MNNKTTIEKDIKIVEKLLNTYEKLDYRFDNMLNFEETQAIENILADREKYKRLAEQNLKDSEEFKNNMCKHRCIKYNEILDLQSKANKYDSLIKEIEDKKEKLEKEYKDAIDKNSTKAFILKCQITIIQELLDKEKEEI